MSFRSIIAALAILSFSTVAMSQAKRERFVAGELLIKYDSSAAALRSAREIDDAGGKVVERFADLGWQRIKTPMGLTVDQSIERFARLEGVVAVQPNFYYELLAIPNDTDFGTLYGMTKISAPAAWDLSTGSSAVVVANIDTGIRYTHDDLAANIWTNPGETNGNSVDDDNNGFVDDYYGVGSSRVDLQACKLEYSIVSPK